MKDLIERLEKATGPDRELANDVLLACGWTAHESTDGPDRHIVWESPDGHGFEDGDQPDPTRSLETAVSLLPKGWAAIVYTETNQTETYVTGPALPGARLQTSSGRCGSPAIATCVAALKACDAAERDLTNMAKKKQMIKGIEDGTGRLVNSKGKPRSSGEHPDTGEYDTAQMMRDEMYGGDTSQPLFD